MTVLESPAFLKSPKMDKVQIMKPFINLTYIYIYIYIFDSIFQVFVKKQGPLSPLPRLGIRLSQPG